MSTREHHVRAVLPFAHELGNQLGRVLQIAVHEHHGVAVAVAYRCGAGGLVAEVARQAHHAHACVAGGKLA
jgi:hypothetical protein